MAAVSSNSPSFVPPVTRMTEPAETQTMADNVAASMTEAASGNSDAVLNPEPSTLVMAGVGALLILLSRTRRSKVRS
jgi:hypothetical protein